MRIDEWRIPVDAVQVTPCPKCGKRPEKVMREWDDVVGAWIPSGSESILARTLLADMWLEPCGHHVGPDTAISFTIENDRD